MWAASGNNGVYKIVNNKLKPTIQAIVTFLQIMSLKLKLPMMGLFG